MVFVGYSDADYDNGEKRVGIRCRERVFHFHGDKLVRWFLWKTPKYIPKQMRDTVGALLASRLDIALELPTRSTRILHLFEVLKVLVFIIGVSNVCAKDVFTNELMFVS